MLLVAATGATMEQILEVGAILDAEEKRSLGWGSAKLGRERA